MDRTETLTKLAIAICDADEMTERCVCRANPEVGTPPCRDRLAQAKAAWKVIYGTGRKAK
jgi:hypothetical protein